MRESTARRDLILAIGTLILLSPLGPAFLAAADWPHWRGPTLDGISTETGLPERWAPDGEDLFWKAPYGARSSPVVLGDRVYLQNGSGEGAELQERVTCFDLATGEVLWEYRFNVFLSDVPSHRIGWASPALDPETGNVYAFGVGGMFLALSRDGQLVWERSLAEELGLITTHGGRTVSPVIDQDLVIVSGLSSGWGEQARGAHRFMAFDKRTGETVWVSSPAQRPYDTTYSPPVLTEIDGTRLLVAGAGDGAVHALKVRTGEPVWRFEMSKRGINTGAVVKGNVAVVSHSEENLDSNVMGFIGAIDASARGELGSDQLLWSHQGFMAGFSSAVVDGERVYQVDNGANLVAFDFETGRRLWTLNLGTIQRASPVLAEGKLYVGTENGRFYILKPGPEGCEILDQVQLGTQAEPEIIYATAAVSQGRVLVVTTDALYCIGDPGKAPPVQRGLPAYRSPAVSPGEGPPAHLQVVPTELVLAPGESLQLRARLFDGKGRLLEEPEANWSLAGLAGEVDARGRFTASSEPRSGAGLVEARVGELKGAARLRVIPPLPWSEDFEDLPEGPVPASWINATGKFQIRQEEGNRMLVKLADNPFTKRARVFMGPTEWSDYTVEVDVRATERRRQMGDGGVVAQRYSLVLFGNHQRVELQPWQPETERTVTAPFAWKPDTWYRMKLRVDNLPDGTTRARGKVWEVGQPEPDEWLVERVDPVPNRKGSPGLYADAPFEVFFDNLKVTPNS